MKVVKGVAPKLRRKSFSGYTNSKFVKNWRNGKTLFRTPRISKLPFPEMIKKWEERDKKALKAIRGVFSRQPQVDDDDVEESKEVMCAQDIQEGNEATGTQTFEEAKEVEHAQEVKKLAKVEEADAEFSDIELSDDGGLDSGVFSFISTPSFIRSRPRLNNVPSSLHLDSFGPNSDFEWESSASKLYYMSFICILVNIFSTFLYQCFQISHFYRNSCNNVSDTNVTRYELFSFNALKLE